MAESIVSFVLERLGDVLIQEAAFQKDVRGQFERLQKELTSIIAFLQAADTNHCDDPDIRVWVADVKDISYDVDDIIDSFFLKVASKDRSGSNNLLKWCASVPKKILDLHNLGKEIDEIFIRIEDISNRRQRYPNMSVVRDRSSSTNDDEVRLRRTYPHAKDDNIIGLEEETENLVTEVMKEGCHLVSICGMGGSGKTTLAKRVYCDRRVNRGHYFDCCAWTCISQQCKTRNVLQEILRQVTPLGSVGREKMTEVEMVEKISANLEDKRYLVVLDDIWTVDAWDMLKAAFPNGKKGSKVMITSQNMNVARHADRRGHHVKPRMLHDNEAWDLICMVAFPKDAGERSWSLSIDMEKCGRDMVKKCGGLPLAIVMLGGVLATKKSLYQWEMISKDIGSYMSENCHGVFAVLAVSYFDLPFHLKHCFLFLGLFPEDYSIPVKDVIRMWIAEGMVTPKQGSQLTMEDLGRQYMDELFQRSMIQVGERTESGGIRTCRLHDMMRDLCIRKASEENFFQVIRNDCSSSQVAISNAKLRRCAIYLEKERYPLSSHIVPCIRTVFFSRGPTFEDWKSLKFFHKDFKLARVLNLHSEHIDMWAPYAQRELSQAIGKLTYLRYLGLRDAVIEELPKSIGNLVFLQTLDVRCYRWPAEIRHIEATPNSKWNQGKLVNTELVKLTNLRKLSVIYVTPDVVTAIVDYVVGGLDSLRSLDICTDDEFYFFFPTTSELPNLETLSSNRRLLKLTLQGKMTTLPSYWPSSLVKLRLSRTEIREDPMPILEKLQNLEYLSLWFRSFQGKEMSCSRDGFPQLRHLKFADLLQFEEWKVEKGAMPRLNTLEIHGCLELSKIPEGLKFLTKLWKLDVHYMPETFYERIKWDGEDWQSVRHISSINLIVV